MSIKIPYIIAPIIRIRGAAIAFAVLPLIFMLLNISELFIWKCPFYEYLNIPCLGCGMTRACKALIQGGFIEAFYLHPFSFILITGWIILTIIILLPENPRKTTINKLEIVESKTGIVYILFFVFLFFGLARLIFQI